LGSGSSEAEAVLDRGKKKLLEDGYCGVVEWIGELGLNADFHGRKSPHNLEAIATAFPQNFKRSGGPV
jgi:hypothetical protein